MTTTGDKRWRQAQERTGTPNNLDSEGPEESTETSRAGSTALTICATNTGGKWWMPDTTPDKWEKEGPCPRMTGGNKEREKRSGHGWGGRGAKNAIADMEPLEGKISDLQSQLNHDAQIIVAKDNDLRQLDKEKENHQQAYNRAKQRMRRIGGILWKKEFSIVGPMQEGDGS